MNKNMVKKIFSNSGKLSKLRLVIFMIVFAVAGTVYLLVSHAADAPPIIGVDAPSCSDGISGWAYQPLSGPPYRGSVTVYVYSSSSSAYFAQVQSDTSNTSDYPSFKVPIPSNDLDGKAHTYTVYAVGSSAETGPGDNDTNVYGQDPTASITCKTTPVAPTPPKSPTPPQSPQPPPTNPGGGSSGGSGGGSSSSGSTTPTQSSPSSGSSSSGHKTSSSSSSTPTVTTGTGTPSDGTDLSTTDVQPATDSANQSLDLSSSPNVPWDSDSIVKSSDGLVSVTFQKGTFGDTDAYCSIDQGDSNSVPFKSANAIGPYSIDCTDNNGAPLNNLKKSVTVAITLPADKTKYTAYVNDSAWVKISSSNDGKTLSFKLAKTEQFATAPAKASNSGTIILNIIGLITLALLVGGFFLLRRRRQNPSADDNYWQ